MTDLQKPILTKIVATVGPGCLNQTTLTKLIDKGARLFRINFSHGQLSDFDNSLKLIRQTTKQQNLPSIGILGDLCGPKIRVGKTPPAGIQLNKGDVIAFTKSNITATKSDNDETIQFSTNTPQMIDQAKPGERLLIDDGAVSAIVVEKSAKQLTAHVVDPGIVTSNKGINLPDTNLTLPSITEWDWQCAKWAVDNQLDFLALSLVRSADDVIELKSGLKKLAENKYTPPIIAKIEKPQAVDHLQDIVSAADGVMVARGDLGVEMDLPQVPIIQKQLITLAHQHGKPVIVATQMLQSMIDSPTPTRAEVSDVANAIFDGVDAVMLSGETAIGKFPVQTVEMMAKTAKLTEANVNLDPGYARLANSKLQNSNSRSAALMGGVSSIVNDLDAKLVVIWSQSGGGARLLAQRRLPMPIIAFSSNKQAVGKMTLLYGVQPILMQPPENLDSFANIADKLILDNNLAKPDDTIVIVLGQPIEEPGATNHVSIHKVTKQ